MELIEGVWIRLDNVNVSHRSRRNPVKANFSAPSLTELSHRKKHSADM